MGNRFFSWLPWIFNGRSHIMGHGSAFHKQPSLMGVDAMPLAFPLFVPGTTTTPKSGRHLPPMDSRREKGRYTMPATTVWKMRCPFRNLLLTVCLLVLVTAQGVPVFASDQPSTWAVPGSDGGTYAGAGGSRGGMAIIWTTSPGSSSVSR